MVKKDENKIEIYEDLSYYKIYRIIGIIVEIVGICFILGLLIKGNKEYIGTYVVCVIAVCIIIGIIFLVKYCNKKIKTPPYIEMIITKEYVEFFSAKGTCESIRKIMISGITKVFQYDGYLVINSINKNNEKEKYSYSFGIEKSNLYLAERELKEILKQK